MRVAAWLKSDVPLFLSVLQVTLALLAGLGVLHLTGDQAGAWEAVAAAVAAVIAAVATRPFHVAPLTLLSTAAFTLITAYGVSAGAGVVSAVNAAVVLLAAMLVRANVSPAPPAPAPAPPPASHAAP